MKKLKLVICTLLVISVFASAGVLAFASKTVYDLSKNQKETDTVIAVDTWMEEQGTSVRNELQKSVENWKRKMNDASNAGDMETAEKCAAIISTQEKLIADFDEYIRSPEFIEHKDALSEEDQAYIDSLLELIRNTQ